MTIAQGNDVEDILGQVVSAVGGFVVAVIGGVGLWWRGRADRDVSEIESKSAATVAQINADSSERIHILDVLSARVTNLEAHNAKQDVLIAELTAQKAELTAQNTLLVEQNKLLRRQVGVLEQEKAQLAQEVALLRDAIQGPISDALESLDEGKP